VRLPRALANDPEVQRVRGYTKSDYSIVSFAIYSDFNAKLQFGELLDIQMCSPCTALYVLEDTCTP